MIGKISAPRGKRVEGLIYYLYGPGRREEHTDPHIVAGWWHPAELEPPLREDGRRDFRRLLGLLNQPHAALGSWGMERPVWHCAVRAAPTNRMLSDDEWALIACDVMHRTGLAPRGQEDDAVRWVAVRHGDDHVHIVAMLARQDGRRPRISNDRYRVREACLAAEERYGLHRTAAADRTAASRPTRAESEKATRKGRKEAPRVTLRREVNRAAAAAGSEQEFFALLKQAGVLIRIRQSARTPGEVTGYAVALAGDTTRAGEPVWFGGGKLAPDLTLPKLRRRWGASSPPSAPLTAAERSAAWEQALRAVDGAAAHVRAMAAGSAEGGDDAAWAAAGTLHVAAAVLGSRILRQAADAYDRASRAPYARIPPATAVGNDLRSAARLLSAFAFVSGDRSIRPVVLITRLAALAEAVAKLRESQQRAAQAASALHAARRLHAAASGAFQAAPGGLGGPRASAVADLAGADFPLTAGPSLAGSSAPPPCRPVPPVTRPSPRRDARRARLSAMPGQGADHMDSPNVYPDLLGEAFSHSGQRLAQLGSLLTSWAMVEARRAERRHAARAARSERELSMLREQERAAWQLARAGWAPAADRKWLAAADLIQTARAWSAAAAYASADPEATSAMARCEGRLRELHPYAVARYDRLRAEGAGAFDAMRDVLPLFARAPHVRPGDRGRERPALATGDGLRADLYDSLGRTDNQSAQATGNRHRPDADRGAATDYREPEARDAVLLAAECFPWPVDAAVHSAASPRATPRPRPAVPSLHRNVTRPSLP